MSLPPTAPPRLGDLKMEDAVAEKWSESGVELTSDGRDLYDQLNVSMTSVWMVYDVLFQRLLEAVKQPSKDIYEDLPSVICRLPYNILQIAQP